MTYAPRVLTLVVCRRSLATLDLAGGNDTIPGWIKKLSTAAPIGGAAHQVYLEVRVGKKEEALEVEGTVTQALANTRFRVQLDDGPIVMAHVAGKMRKHFIRIVPGDRVRVELSPYDLTKGRITYRER